MDLITVILLLVVGMLTGVLVKAAGRWIHLPYTVMLFAIGIVLGLLCKAPWVGGLPFFADGIHLVSKLDPDFILYIFLPILVFDAAYEMDLHVFRKTLFNASLLAGPGLVVCMLLTAAMVMGINTLLYGYDASLWPFALMFGGLISATDPVAVVALLQELGTKKRFSTLVDGESLLNDGTGLVCFMMFYCTYAGQSAIENPLLYFIWVVVASAAIGYVFGRIAIWLVKHIATEQTLQNCVMIAGAYTTFMLAQKAFDVSGVIALVVFGQYFAQSCRPHLKPEVNEWMEKFWSLLAYIANTLIFLIVGVIIATDVHLTWKMVLGIIPVFIGLNLIRYLMILVFMPILKRNGYGLNWREFVILGWGGLRGALGMSMALMVNCNENIPEQIREHILVYTAGVVTLTLCINATTSKRLVQWLRLIPETSASEQHIWSQLIARIRHQDQDTLERLKQDSYLAQADWQSVESKMIAPVADEATPSLSREEMLCVMRRTLQAHIEMTASDYFHSGVLNYKSYKQILGDLAILNDFEGAEPITSHELNKGVRRPTFWRSQRRLVTEGCNLCRGYNVILTESRDFISHVLNTDTLNLTMQQETADIVLAEIDALNSLATSMLDQYRQMDAEAFKAGVTDKATRILLASERNRVTRLLSEGVITQDAAERLYADIARRQGLEILNS